MVDSCIYINKLGQNMSANMMDPDARSGWDHSAPIDWNSPELSALLAKTSEMGLDKRNAYDAKPVFVHVGWSTQLAGAHSATIVAEGDGAAVIEASFHLGQGERVRIEKRNTTGVRTMWATVIESKVGTRARDKKNGTIVYWLAVKQSR